MMLLSLFKKKQKTQDTTAKEPSSELATGAPPSLLKAFDSVKVTGKHSDENTFMAVLQAYLLEQKEAEARGEEISLFTLIGRAMKRATHIIEQNKSLPNGTNATADTGPTEPKK